MSWSRATLVKNERVAPALHRLWLNVSNEVAAGFKLPGQYHRVRLPDGEHGTFAMASAPGIREFEYLLRGVGQTAEALIALGVGAQVEVGEVEGPGFPLERAVGRNVVLIGTGTGFAPLRSVLLTVGQRRAEFGTVHALYGAHDYAQLAFAEEFDLYARLAMHITPTVSRADAEWAGHVGHVQSALGSIPVEGAAVFLCGQATMVSEVTKLLTERGVAPSDISLNLPVF